MKDLKEDKAIASGRLELLNDRAYIKWIAVKKTYRNKTIWGYDTSNVN